MALVGVEPEDRAVPRRHLLNARLHIDGTVDHDEQRRLLDLVVAQALPGLQADQDRARLSVLGVQDDRRAASLGRVDLHQVPALHGE